MPPRLMQKSSSSLAALLHASNDAYLPTTASADDNVDAGAPTASAKAEVDESDMAIGAPPMAVDQDFQVGPVAKEAGELRTTVAAALYAAPRQPSRSAAVGGGKAGGTAKQRRRSAGNALSAIGIHPTTIAGTATASHSALSSALPASGNAEQQSTAAFSDKGSGIAPLRASRTRTQVQVQQASAAASATAAAEKQQQHPDAAAAAAREGDSTDSEDFYDDSFDLDDEGGELWRKERYEPWQYEYTPVEQLRWADKALKEECLELVRRYLEEDTENLAAAVPLAPAGEAEPEIAEGGDRRSGSNSLFRGPVAQAAKPTDSSSGVSGAVVVSSAAGSGPVSSTITTLQLPAAMSLAHQQRLRTASPAPSSGSSTPGGGPGTGTATPTATISRVASAISAPLLPVIITSPLTPSQAASLSPSEAMYIKPLASTALSLAPPTCTPFSAPACPISLMNPYPRPTIHAAFTQTSHSAGSLISLMNGEVLAGDEYRKNPMNQWRISGAGKNFTRFIGLPWDLVLDQRRWADESRFVRHGCHPNVYVRPVIVRRSTGAAAGQQGKRSVAGGGGGKKRKIGAFAAAAGSSTAEYELAFGLYAIHDIGKREELVLPTDWADDHVVHALHTLLFAPELVFPTIPSNVMQRGSGSSSDEDGIPSTSSFTYLSAGQKAQIASCTAHLYALSRLASGACVTLLGESPCSCEKRRDCALGWLWKLAGASEASSKHRGSIIKREDFDLNALKSACATALAGTAGPTRGKSSGNVKRRANLGPLVGLPRGWRTRDGAEEISAIPPEPRDVPQQHQKQVWNRSGALPAPLRPAVQPSQRERDQDEPMEAQRAQEEEEDIDLADDQEDVSMEVDAGTSTFLIKLLGDRADIAPFGIAPLPVARETEEVVVLSSTEQEAVKLAQTESKAGAEAATAPTSPALAANAAVKPARSDSDSESDLTEPLPSGGEGERPAAAAAAKKKTGKAAPAPRPVAAAKRGGAKQAVKSKEPAKEARPKLKTGASSFSRGRKVIQDESSADEDDGSAARMQIDKTAPAAAAAPSDSSESEDDVDEQPVRNQPAEPAKKKGKAAATATSANEKAKRPSLQRKDSKQKQSGSSTSLYSKDKEREKANETQKTAAAPEKFKAKTKSGSNAAAKATTTATAAADKEPKEKEARPKSAGGLPAFRKKSMIDEERAKQLKSQKRGASPAQTSVIELHPVLQKAATASGASTVVKEPQMEVGAPPAEPELTGLFDVELTPVQEPSSDQKSPVPTSTALEEGSAMQLDEPLAAQPRSAAVVVPQITQQFQHEALTEPAVPAPASVPVPAAAPMVAPAEPPPPPRRVSFMAYKQRNLPKASPTASVSDVATTPIVEEPAALTGNSPSAAKEETESSPSGPVQVTDRPMADTPVVEKSEIGPKVASPIEEKKAEAFLAPPTPATVAESQPAPTAASIPAPPAPKARLSFAAYRQRLSNTPATPSEEAAPAASPKPTAIPTAEAAQSSVTMQPVASDKPASGTPEITEKPVVPHEAEAGSQKVAADPSDAMRQADATLDRETATFAALQDQPADATTGAVKAMPEPSTVQPIAAAAKTETEEGEVSMEISRQAVASPSKANPVGPAALPPKKEQVSTPEVTVADLPAAEAASSIRSGRAYLADCSCLQRLPIRRESATPPPRAPAKASQASEPVKPVYLMQAKKEEPVPVVPAPLAQPPTAPRSKWSNAGSPPGSYASLPPQSQLVQQQPGSVPPLSPPSGPRSVPTGPRTSVPPAGPSGSTSNPAGPSHGYGRGGRGGTRGVYHGRGGGGPPRGRGDGHRAPAGPRSDRDPPSAPRAFGQGQGRGRGHTGPRYDGVPSGPASMMPRDKGWGSRGSSGGVGDGGRGSYRAGGSR